jgi:hypothetical protein
VLDKATGTGTTESVMRHDETITRGKLEMDQGMGKLSRPKGIGGDKGGAGAAPAGGDVGGGGQGYDVGGSGQGYDVGGRGYDVDRKGTDVGAKGYDAGAQSAPPAPAYSVAPGANPNVSDGGLRQRSKGQSEGELEPAPKLDVRCSFEATVRPTGWTDWVIDRVSFFGLSETCMRSSCTSVYSTIPVLLISLLMLVFLPTWSTAFEDIMSCS